MAAPLRLELRLVDPQSGRFHIVSVDVLQAWLLETPPEEVARRALVPALVALRAEVQRDPRGIAPLIMKGVGFARVGVTPEGELDIRRIGKDDSEGKERS